MEERQRAHDAAVGDLNRLLSDSPFDDLETARAALRAPAEIAAAEAESAQHAAAITAARERLLELELAVVGAEIADDELAES